jgi:hypothetical protein
MREVVRALLIMLAPAAPAAISDHASFNSRTTGVLPDYD